ncbi:biofilm-forming protein [Bacillus swezeyi]|uniref:Biofilm-forming protein n=1 Tax=Bacillus swezeyi TaxID=1925020 RepID=A0A5M8RT68_9BACI|nr:biofilm-forming protein [Bacillus swezeyi]KAA6451825.1 biofilm-forming protein [Bacillus swezeyi]KAA6482631.1 biofilm-forming protein [Bacillus swezeyi]TYS36049.1 biofilm-forming protein [Bacillus swezeyi]
MQKKGIQNSSIEQLKNDHETESAFQQDQKNNKQKKNGGTLK